MEYTPCASSTVASVLQFLFLEVGCVEAKPSDTDKDDNDFTICREKRILEGNLVSKPTFLDILLLFVTAKHRAHLKFNIARSETVQGEVPSPCESSSSACVVVNRHRKI